MMKDERFRPVKSRSEFNFCIKEIIMPVETKSVSLRDIYVEHLRDLYSAEYQIIEVLPHIVERVTAQTVKDALQEHLNTTRLHIERLDQIFDVFNQDPQGKKCVGMAGILQEGSEEMARTMESTDLMDAVLIATCLKVEHYEISAYETVIAFTQLLGETDASNLLTKTLEEEKAAQGNLGQLRLTEVMQSTDTLRTHNPEGRSIKNQITANDTLGG
jgi:ferritin-like metal-binding protein YciE